MGNEFETSMAIYCPSCNKKLELSVRAPRAGRTHAIYKRPGFDPEGDLFFNSIRRWCTGKQLVTSCEVMRDALGIDRTKWSVPIRRRVCSIIRHLGYVDVWHAEDGIRYRAFELKGPMDTTNPQVPADAVEMSEA
jgi:hypothetical protein